MNFAIIAAAGRGTRIGGEQAKQFLDLAGIPIIIHTLQAFERCELIQKIIVVLPASESATFLSLTNKHGLRKVAAVVAGGATRADSVQRGLNAIDAAAAEIVAVHDGVRPFVTGDEIARTIVAAQEHGSAILVAPVVDTIKQVENGKVVRTLDRTQLRRALTPQCFRYSLLQRAYEQADVLDPELTDESVLFERLGWPIVAVDGSTRNLKITQAEDLAVGEMLLKKVS